jgi:hypothetical protein
MANTTAPRYWPFRFQINVRFQRLLDVNFVDDTKALAPEGFGRLLDGFVEDGWENLAE